MIRMCVQYFFILAISLLIIFLPRESCHFWAALVKAFFLDLCLSKEGEKCEGLYRKQTLGGRDPSHTKSPVIQTRCSYVGLWPPSPECLMGSHVLRMNQLLVFDQIYTHQPYKIMEGNPKSTLNSWPEGCQWSKGSLYFGFVVSNSSVYYNNHVLYSPIRSKVTYIQIQNKTCLPVLVESPLAFLWQMLGPNGLQHAQTTWRLDVTNDTNADHGGSFNDGHSFQHLFPVDLWNKAPVLGFSIPKLHSENDTKSNAKK